MRLSRDGVCTSFGPISICMVIKFWPRNETRSKTGPKISTVLFRVSFLEKYLQYILPRDHHFSMASKSRDKSQFSSKFKLFENVILVQFYIWTSHLNQNCKFEQFGPKLTWTKTVWTCVDQNSRSNA